MPSSPPPPPPSAAAAAAATSCVVRLLLGAGCGGKADIVFLLDKSGSVGQSNFNKMLEFVKDVSSNFDIGPNDVQIGVDTFSSSFSSEFTLGRFGNKNGVSNAVDHIP